MLTWHVGQGLERYSGSLSESMNLITIEKSTSDLCKANNGTHGRNNIMEYHGTLDEV